MKCAINIENIIKKSSAAGIVAIDSLGNVLQYNKDALYILDIKSHEMQGKKIHDLLPFLNINDLIDPKIAEETKKIQLRDKVLKFEILPINDTQEKTFIIQFKDITWEEKEVDDVKSAKILCNNMDDVIESSYDGIYITDGKANTLRINKSYERITGMKREEMLGQNMRDLVDRGYISQSVSLMVLETGKIATIQQDFKTGKKALVTATPIYDNEGGINLIVTNIRDITELHKLDEKLKKNEKLTEKYYLEIEEMRKQLLSESQIISQDKKMFDLIYIAKRVAAVDTTVLLLGETGVGKEVFAKYIHSHSLRKKGQYIKINCGAIPENLIEAELFGYEKGSFTGAAKNGKPGLIEIADGGTLFLDEVGELPLDMQVKLLRVLQESELTRVGGIKPTKVDVRIIAATNRNLEEMIKAKKFREDLFYRLNVVPLTIPPLRERREDITPLVIYYLKEFNEKYQFSKKISPGCLNCLLEYDWPGNVRELKNIVERVMVVSADDFVTEEELPKYIGRVEIEESLFSPSEIIPLKDAVGRIEEMLIDKAFNKYGNVRDAAKALEIDASTFVRKRQRYKK